ncbi:hypothetical protein LIER_25207 [Lithospermum erythrorhizon]|uniref:Uncharacterized protein n=1 Tax=Lithospermum erythrorhizon TaxID=34254 RepID=A0AAV3R7X2_LITER
MILRTYHHSSRLFLHDGLLRGRGNPGSRTNPTGRPFTVFWRQEWGSREVPLRLLGKMAHGTLSLGRCGTWPGGISRLNGGSRPDACSQPNEGGNEGINKYGMSRERKVPSQEGAITSSSSNELLTITSLVLSGIGSQS